MDEDRHLLPTLYIGSAQIYSYLSLASFRILLQLSLNKRIDPIYSSLSSFELGEIVDINILEERVDELIQLCDELDKKRGSLENERRNWMQERASLLKKNEMAKTKIEAMIMRLKSLDQD